tara:strand:- start:633 stop:2162 length:1530 start_codon:yes stop_codon:yes gene_type:complete
MDSQKVLDSLHPFERKVFPLLDKNTSVNHLVQATKLEEVEVIRALQWLENRNLIKLEKASETVVKLGENGKTYASKGLPEKRLLNLLSEKSLSLREIAQQSDLSREEVSISIGTLKRSSCISIQKAKEPILFITDKGNEVLQKGIGEEEILKKQFPLKFDELSKSEKEAIKNLEKRKGIVKVEDEKTTIPTLTASGKKLIKQKANIKTDLLDSLTPKIIKSGEWKDKKFRRYDVKINVPKVNAGKKQHYRRFLDDIRKKFLSLGFKESFGPLVETDFWDMDALFMPQFHSARDIHQGYYVKEPKYSTELPKDIVNNVKQAHESGFNTGSTGWKYDFDLKRTHRNILRTHDTAISARLLASKDLQIPGKYFQMARCFRYDVIDATHLSDFNQVGGFVIEEGINFRHLKGLLKMFAEEFCETDQIKITPSYFPFTEPSVELHAKHPDLGWVELAGSGIFRPEMVTPLVGKDVPVIAWGIGLDRLAMFKLGIKDIRNLFSHDLEFLRSAKVI